ncbi:hypothetical protein BPNPMPFG_002488 [Mesorhizobium sp. AR07]|uniref:hypothetical protein n=1 Tax=Mesorhizobium sp. AR07 TaxID=2865838 RepID=UPI0021606C45|nr:hypothetical protein [Mesorhizobium sp. AR07]UVK46780.1 hypothetical protein BPNPMPFG_002488 [Mesorhizobium sp. AR07]
MFGWSSSAEEYQHIRQVMVEAPFGGDVIVSLLNGQPLAGTIVGTNSMNDAADNIRAGRGPRITSIFCEITLLLDNGHKIVLNAMEIKSIATVATA